MGFEKGKEFAYFLCKAWNVNKELANYFTNALALSVARVSLQVKAYVLL